MSVMNLLSTLNRSLRVKIRTVLSKHVQRNASQLKTSYDLKSHISEDVVIFNFENPKFFIFLNIFATIQCFSWSYLGLYFFQSLKHSIHGDSEKKFERKILEIERKYGFPISVISTFFGWSVLAATTFYSFRSIRKIILHKGGKDVTIVTYSLPGLNTIKIPLSNVSSFVHRTKAKKFIPVKLKNRYFYYLIDVQGEFSNPTLFDFTTGIKRTF